MTGIVAHSKTESWLTLTGQVAHWNADYSEAQADFGTADFYENGKLHHEAKYLVLSFPYSNGGFFQLNYGENMECLLEGLVAIFEHIGGVPTEIWFDNTRTIVTKIIKGGWQKYNGTVPAFLRTLPDQAPVYEP